MAHLPSPLVLLVLAAAAGCADPSRLDAVEAGLARVRGEGAQRDRQIEWLRWGQTVLAERSAHGGSRDPLAQQVAALEAENAVLRQRLDRAERRLAASQPDPDRPRPASPPALPPSPAKPAHTRTLDQRVPYGLAARPADDRGDAPAHVPPDARAKPPRRTLDETVPY